MILEDAYVKFLIEHKLTQNQYLLLHLVHKQRPDLIKEYKQAFPSDDTTMIGQYFVDDLFRKGFLDRKGDGTIVVSTKFLEIFTNKHTASDEIFEIYPTHWSKDGVSIPLSAMDRNVFANLYDKAISSSVLEHLEVVKDIKYAIQENLLGIGIDKFVKSKYWLIIRPKRLDNLIKENVQTVRDHDY